MYKGDEMGKGFLKITLFAGDDVLPVKNAKVFVKDTEGNILYTLVADENGLVRTVSLDAPDKKYSLDPANKLLCFSAYDVEVLPADGYKKVIVHDVQIFDTETSILPVHLHPEIVGDTPQENTDEIFIPPEHGVELPGREAEVTPADNGDMTYFPGAGFSAGATALANEVQIPYYITVHLGSPNASATNVRVPFIDYIKNVASSEIFPTWEESALIANIYCQISFALNRTYTVWYRSRGFDFDITNSTAFDQYFVYGRNIFENISRIVDGIFNNFIRRAGRREPFFAQYCNGTTSKCDGLSQWGSQDLALRGYDPMQILKYYYPNDIQIVESTNFSSDVGTYPGAPLREGSSGPYVRTMQTYLNRISGNFYIPPIPNIDGIFGAATKNTTIEFQRINNLIADGIIGKSTWYSITKIFVAVAELAELTSEGERIGIGNTPPTSVIQMGARGEDVVELQFLLNYISEFFPVIPFVIQNGVFRDDTKRSVVEFQKEFGLTPDGIVGPATWKKLYDVYHSIKNAVEPPATHPQYPGTPLRIGSRGDDVLFMQKSLNSIAKFFPAIATLTADGIFGSGTAASVTAFQRLFGLTADGVIGRITWDKIVSVSNNLPSTVPPAYPGTALRVGSRGNDVLTMQRYLNSIAAQYPSIPLIATDGIFGAGTERSVIAFQRQFGLTADGVIGRITWNQIVSVYNVIRMNFPLTYTAGVSSMTDTADMAVAATNRNTPTDKYAMLMALRMLRRY